MRINGLNCAVVLLVARGTKTKTGLRAPRGPGPAARSSLPTANNTSRPPAAPQDQAGSRGAVGCCCWLSKTKPGPLQLAASVPPAHGTAWRRRWRLVARGGGLAGAASSRTARCPGCWLSASSRPHTQRSAHIIAYAPDIKPLLCLSRRSAIT
jgi:hypothetical protein